MKSKYDMHIATEAGNSVILKVDLAALGFQDDNLAFQGLVFDEETAQHYKNCPLIDVHASKKVATHEELLTLEDEVHQLMLTHGVTGYWHSEYIKADEHIESANPLNLKPLPFRRLRSRPRDTEKVWDIHLSMQDDILPEALKKLLINHGLYYLARLKTLPDIGEKRFAVFTVQGINPVAEGVRFYTTLCEWLKAVGAPPCDIKMEITTAMKVYNAPKAVPPTIEMIEWI